MRDLYATGQPDNGGQPLIDPEEAGPLPAGVASQPVSYRTVQRDQKLAEITVMLLDAAKILEPVLELLCNRALRWAILASNVGLAFYALRHPSWERLSIFVAFMLLSPLVLLRHR